MTPMTKAECDPKRHPPYVTRQFGRMSPFGSWPAYGRGLADLCVQVFVAISRSTPGVPRAMWDEIRSRTAYREKGGLPLHKSRRFRRATAVFCPKARIGGDQIKNCPASVAINVNAKTQKAQHGSRPRGLRSP